MMVTEGEVAPKFRYAGPPASEIKRRREKITDGLSKTEENIHDVESPDTLEKRDEL